jgi:hypothetical protein
MCTERARGANGRSWPKADRTMKVIRNGTRMGGTNLRKSNIRREGKYETKKSIKLNK